MSKSIVLVVKPWLTCACSVGGKLCLTISPKAIETQCQCTACLCEALCLLYITMWAQMGGLRERDKDKRGATEGGKNSINGWIYKTEDGIFFLLLYMKVQQFTVLFFGYAFLSQLIDNGARGDASSQIRSCMTAATASGKHLHHTALVH